MKKKIEENQKVDINNLLEELEEIKKSDGDPTSPVELEKAKFVMEEVKQHLSGILAIRKGLKNKISFIIGFLILFSTLCLSKIIDILVSIDQNTLAIDSAIIVLLSSWKMLYLFVAFNCVKKGFLGNDVYIIGIEPKALIRLDMLKVNTSSLILAMAQWFQTHIEENDKENNKYIKLIKESLSRILYFPLFAIILSVFVYFYSI